jgi:hypothetical protein
MKGNIWECRDCHQHGWLLYDDMIEEELMLTEERLYLVGSMDMPDVPKDDPENEWYY